MDNIILGIVIGCLIGLNIVLAVQYEKKRIQADGLLAGFIKAPHPIFAVDTEGKLVHINYAGEKYFTSGEKERNRWIQEHFDGWMKKLEGKDLTNQEWDEKLLINEKEHFFHIEEIAIYDSKKVLIGYRFSFEDRSEVYKVIEENEYKATHDALTGLLNRDTFYKMVEETVRNDPDTPRYMVCTNIRNFKLVNDLFGHKMGDRVLQDQAMMLCRASYEGTLHGRISGDRFAMLIEKKNFNPELATKNTSQLQYLFGESNHRLHILIGVYQIMDPMESASVMFDKANMAIEYCRDDYQEFIITYTKDMMERLIYEKELISDFEGALKNHEFQLYLQPQILKDGKLKGAEALVRWNHPRKGLLQPKYFIDVLEKAGFIIKLDQYMWEATCAKLREWKDMGREDLNLSVNISAKDFYYIDIYETLTNLARKYDINPYNLSLEITETVFISDVGSHLDILERLQDFGFKIGIDDFGSGYSSLNMLKDITADILKIDMVFLQETRNHFRRWIILDSVISMAKELGMEIVTEGIEDEEQYKKLVQMGSDVFQGFYFDEPLAPEVFEEKYLKG